MGFTEGLELSNPTLSVLCPFLSTMFSVCRSQAAFLVEIVALRHQDRCAATLRQETPQVDHCRSCLLGMVVWSLGPIGDPRWSSSNPRRPSLGIGKAIGFV